MTKITQLARTRNTRSCPSAKRIWLTDHEINACELLRVELRQQGERAVVDVRRWRRKPGEAAQATGRGFALSIRHLRAFSELLNAALAEAEAAGLLDKGGTS